MVQVKHFGTYTQYTVLLTLISVHVFLLLLDKGEIVDLRHELKQS